MVSSTLCPAVHILGSQNVYGRAEGIAFFFLSVSVSFSFFVFVFPVIYCLRDIFSFSHRIKKVCMCTCMHVCTCACMHVCVSEVRGGGRIWITLATSWKPPQHFIQQWYVRRGRIIFPVYAPRLSRSSNRPER